MLKPLFCAIKHIQSITHPTKTHPTFGKHTVMMTNKPKLEIINNKPKLEIINYLLPESLVLIHSCHNLIPCFLTYFL